MPRARRRQVLAQHALDHGAVGDVAELERCKGEVDVEVAFAHRLREAGAQEVLRFRVRRRQEHHERAGRPARMRRLV